MAKLGTFSTKSASRLLKLTTLTDDEPNTPVGPVPSQQLEMIRRQTRDAQRRKRRQPQKQPSVTKFSSLHRMEKVKTVLRSQTANLVDLDVMAAEKVPKVLDESDENILECFPGVKLLENSNSLVKTKFERKTLFKDDKFTPIQAFPEYRTLLDEYYPGAKIIWLRPHQISNNPILMDKSLIDQRRGVVQGYWQNCWLLSTLGNIALYPEVLERIIPDNQTFEGPTYNGKFTFNFNLYGSWVKVTIDDRIPVIKYPFPSKKMKIYGCRSENPNEFWSALLEKAYAKLNGGYHILGIGTPNQAMADLTGGAIEEIQLKDKVDAVNDFFNMIENLVKHRALINTSIQALTMQELEIKRSDGLIAGHAYSITGLKEYTFDDIPYKLIRLRNPWGKQEWNGAFSDSDERWSDVSDQQFDQENYDDGEFWMTMEDYCKNFTHMHICRLNLYHYEMKGHWHKVQFDGRWSDNLKTNGGLKDLINNPFVPIEIDQNLNNQGQFIAILQHKLTRNEKLELAYNYGHDLTQANVQNQVISDFLSHPIGLGVYKITKSKRKTINEIKIDRTKLDELLNIRIKEENGVTTSRLKHNKDKIFAALLNARDYNLKLSGLEAGKLAIVPYSVKSAVDKSPAEGRFLLRVYIEKKDQ